MGHGSQHCDVVTSQKDHQLRADTAPGEIGQHLAQLVRLEGELLPDVEGRGAVREAGDEERVDHEPCRPWKSAPAPSVASSTQNPAIAK